MSGKSLPAYSYGNPNFYYIVKKNDKEMVIGAWNLFEDDILKPVFELDEEYSSVETCGCECKIEGKKILLSRIEPFGNAFIHLKK